MTERTPIVNISGDHEETIVQLARHLGTSKIRRKVFDAVYGRGSKPRTKKQIMEVANIPAKGNNGQQVQNELDHLAKHHLIVRLDNKGVVRDGSRNLYQKDPTIRANKEKIIRLADNRLVRERMPTKRRSVANGSVALRSINKRSLRRKQKLKVLYLVANPDPSNPLRVDVEVRRVQEAIRGSKFRDNVRIEYRPAADLKSLIDGLNDLRPQIVQFSGHGSRSGIATDTAKVTRPSVRMLSFETLSRALAATDTPPTIVLLNSCSSASAKKSLLSASAPAAEIVIAMQAPVTDLAAAVFATHFYAAIAAGQSIKAAFDQGKVAILDASIGDVDTPVLLCRKGVNPAKIMLT